MSMTTLARPSGTTTLSTADVESGRGFDYWADAVTSTFVPLECRTQQSAAFHGDLVNRCLGDFQFTLVSAEAHRVARTRKMIALNDPGLMKVCLQVRGTGRINQDGREAEILPGDLTMYDTSRPYVLSYDHNPRGFETLVFMFPQAMMGLPDDAMLQLTATRVNGTEGIGLLVAPFFRGIAEAIAQDRLTFNGRLALNAVSLLETVYRERLDKPAGDAEGAGAGRLVMIQTWLDRHLADPALSPELIAKAHHISVRYLHRLFAADETSVSRWVKERRLAGSRRELADPALVRLSVGAIAARWGMHDPAAFSRSFRAAYGVSPREYRLRTLGMGPGVLPPHNA
ncbi:AraC-like ligand-binding domain-containing protein [Nocardioides dilutus]